MVIMNTKELAKISSLESDTDDTDFEVQLLEDDNSDHISPRKNVPYLLAGIFFGIILVKSEVISWFRIQEMFRLQSFHMYGVIGSAVVVGMISIWLIKKLKVKTVHGEKIVLHPKKFHKGQIFGGLMFGLGWALTGACPGPLFAQIGTGVTVVIVSLLSAIAGTWTYGLLRKKLPH
jgi:uncharacterized membrane protein YedE/YeeE